MKHSANRKKQGIQNIRLLLDPQLAEAAAQGASSFIQQVLDLFAHIHGFLPPRKSGRWWATIEPHEIAVGGSLHLWYQLGFGDEPAPYSGAGADPYIMVCHGFVETGGDIFAEASPAKWLPETIAKSKTGEVLPLYAWRKGVGFATRYLEPAFLFAQGGVQALPRGAVADAPGHRGASARARGYH